MKNRPDKNDQPRDEKTRDENHEVLRQQLWELAYGLLEPQDEAALVARVKSDPALARLYAEVKLQTDLVSTAARVEDSSLSISAAGAGVGSSVNVHKDKRSPVKSPSRTVPAAKASSGSFGTNWLAVVGTTALLLLLGYGLWQPTSVIDSVVQGEFYYTRITGLAAMTEGVSQKVDVEYKDIHNNGRATELDVRLVDQHGQETYRRKVKTSADGRAEIDLPGVVLKKGVRLEVAPADSRQLHREEVVSAELQVADEKRKTVLLTERPYTEPGETNRFQLFGVGTYSKSITPPATDELMVEKQSGGDVVQPMWTVDPDNGVINGAYQLPKTYSANDGLAMRRRSADASREQAKQQVPQQGGDTERMAAGGAVGGYGGGGGGNYESGAKPAANARALDRAENTLRQADANARESFELQQGTNGAAKSGMNKTGRAKPGNAERDEQSDEGGRGTGAGGAKRGLVRNTGPAGAAASPPAAPGTPGIKPAAPAIASAGISPQNVAPTALPDDLGSRKNAATPAPADKPTADAAPPKPGAVPAVNAPAPAPPAPVPGPPAPAVPDAPSESKPKELPPQKSQPDELQLKDQQHAKAEKSAVPAEHPTAPIRQETERLSGVAEAKKGAELRKSAESLQELKVAVPSPVRGEDLVLVARDGDGRIVARRELTAYKEAGAKVTLPPEVNGLVDVELFRKDQPDAPVLRQQVVRASARSLHLEVAGLKEAYAPGEKVQLTVRVLDEEGHPAPAAASVRVWNEVAARAASSPLLLVDSLSQDDLDVDAAKLKESIALAGNALAANLPSDLEAAEHDRAGTKAIETEKGAAQVKGIAGEDQPASEVFFVDNQSIAQQKYEHAAAIQEMHRAERLQAFGRILMWAGAGLMLLVGVLLVSRRPLKSAVWIPAVGLAALSLALGVYWFLPPQHAGVQLAKLLPDEAEKSTGELLTKSAKSPDVKSESAPAMPFASDAPTVQIAPEAPTNSPAPPQAEVLKQLAQQSGGAPAPPASAAPNPSEEAVRVQSAYSPTPAFGAGRGQGGYGGNADRNLGADKKYRREDAQQFAEKKQGEPQPQAGDATSGGQAAAKKADGGAANRDQLAEGVASDKVLPDSLFWRPLSPIERDGTFTIEFIMPAAESDYRLLIDAIGSGRIGGKEQLLRCRP